MSLLALHGRPVPSTHPHFPAWPYIHGLAVESNSHSHGLSCHDGMPPVSLMYYVCKNALYKTLARAAAPQGHCARRLTLSGCALGALWLPSECALIPLVP